jgi:hypothetical protein
MELLAMSHRIANRGLTIAATLALLLTATPRLAFSWGDEGHHIVGDVAEAALANNPAILTKVQTIFGSGVHLRDFATCADRIREFVRAQAKKPADLDPTCKPFVAKFAAPSDLPGRFPHSDKWHFIDIAVDGKQHSLADVRTFCDPNGCAPKMIEHYRDALTPTAGSAVQAEAILFLTHLVGDIHQPLHSAERNNDVGGNLVLVTFFSHPFKLHPVWDDEIIKNMTDAQGKPLPNPDSRAQFVVSSLPQPGTVDPWQWSLDANAKAVSTAYVDNGQSLPDKRNPPGVTLHSAMYQAAGNPVVVAQLRLAGVRLARLLSDRLSSPAPLSKTK